MSDFQNVNGEKLLEYATAFLLLIFFSAAFSRWIQGSDFFSARLIFALFVLSAAFLFVFLRLKNKRLERFETAARPMPKKEQAKTPPMSFEEMLRQEKEAHAFIVKLCEAKNIRLTLKQEGRSGHCEIPEIWTLERPVPLAPDELRALAANQTLRAATVFQDDGIAYAESFTRGGGWTVYEQENRRKI